MTIWVDADACPNMVKEILFRAAVRTQMPAILVANQPLRVPASKYIRALCVPAGFDVADNHIVQHVQAGDLVITADIPLAWEVLENSAEAMSPRGEKYSPETIRQKLTLRDFMDQMRGSGERTQGPAPQHQRDVQAFANQLDKWLAKPKKNATNNKGGNAERFRLTF